MTTFKAKAAFVVDSEVLIRYQSENKKCIIPEGIKELGKYSFAGTDVEKVICPTSLEVIDDCAFCNCWNLKEIHLNRDLKLFGQAPFANCDNLRTVYYDGTKDEYERILKGEPFGEVVFVFSRQ